MGMQTNNNKVTKFTTKYEDIDATRINITQLEENERSNGQLIGFVKYQSPTSGEEIDFNVQSPFFKIVNYGIPTLGKYYETDAQRLYVKVPMDISNKEVATFVEQMSTIDKILGSEKFKSEQFGKKASKYNYSPIIRYTEDDDGNQKMPYLKLKFKTWYNPVTKSSEKVTTNFTILDDNDEIKEQLEISSVTEATEYLRYLSEFRTIMRAIKVWAHNPKTKNPEYGMVFKAEKIQIKPQKGGNTVYKSYYAAENNAFLSDSDDEEIAETDKVEVKDDSDDDEKVEKKASTKKKAKKEKEKEKEKESDSDSDSDSD